MRVGIDARLVPNLSGGVQQLILGLAYGLSLLDESGDEYVFVVAEGQDAWLRENLKSPCSAISVFDPRYSNYGKSTTRGFLRRIPGLVKLASLYRDLRARLNPQDIVSPAPSSGVFEKLGVDVVHFPLQAAELVSLPNIYHPHDLQHIHYPAYFSRFERAVRDCLYRAYCERASFVAVASGWVKRDLVSSLGVAGEKIRVVSLAPPNSSTAYDLLPAREAEIVTSLRLPESYFFYPAQTWPHKNHDFLITALKRLHDGGRPVHLVLSGHMTEHHKKLLERVRALELGAYVHFLGFVSPDTLQVLYRRALACVIPSLFEAGSFPAWEAFLAGTPVACSNVTSLPDQVGKAALLFDPYDLGQLEEVMNRLYDDPVLRDSLRRAGTERVHEFSWKRTAAHFRALYRSLAGEKLHAPDIELLNAPSLM